MNAVTLSNAVLCIFVRRHDRYDLVRLPNMVEVRHWCEARAWRLEPLKRGWKLVDGLGCVRGNVEYEVLCPGPRVGESVPL